MTHDERMERPDHLAHLRRDGDLLLATAAEGLDRPVPTCPGWTCERLVGHIGRTHRWTAGWIASTESPPLEEAPRGSEVVAWARDGLDQVVAAIEALDVDSVVDTWLGRQPATFWARRMAIETALHRVDAQSAAGPGAVTPVATDLAVDAVDELFEVVLSFVGTGDLARSGRTIHLHATDDDLPAGSAGEWLVTFGPEGVDLTHEHAKGDVAVRASASDLLLLLWNRRDPEALQVFGDGQVLADWQAHVRV
jgi:uncharacterized protein (TIGR03083 family)